VGEGTEYRRLEVGELLDRNAAPTPDPGGGAVAALVASLAAGLVAMAARMGEDGWDGAGATAEAEALQARLTALAREDAASFRRALDAERAGAGEAELEAARDRACRVPMRIAEAAAEVVELAARARPHVSARVTVDLAAAAILAEAAGRAAGEVVRCNAGEGDRRLAETLAVLRRAADRAAELSP
jgi:formiminotetrahydrofolate cyclodeaminase